MDKFLLLATAGGLLTANSALAQAPAGSAPIGTEPATTVPATTAVRRAAPAAATTAGAAVLPNPDQWRYVWHNNEWWYYTPQKAWLRWNGTAWIRQANTTYGMFEFSPAGPYGAGYRYGPAPYTYRSGYAPDGSFSAARAAHESPLGTIDPTTVRGGGTAPLGGGAMGPGMGPTIVGPAMHGAIGDGMGGVLPGR